MPACRRRAGWPARPAIARTHAYGPPDGAPAVYGGPVSRQGVRAVPSLMYLERQPNFSIGPDNDENETVSLTVAGRAGTRARGRPRPPATRRDRGQYGAARRPVLGRQGGHAAGTGMGPLLSPFEMDGGASRRVGEAAARVLCADARATVRARCSPRPGWRSPRRCSRSRAIRSRTRAFHPYTSKFDYWLEGKTRLTPAELRGYRAVQRSGQGELRRLPFGPAAPDGLPPVFTDGQFEALGAPRKLALAANRDPAYFDLGICGPYRTTCGTRHSLRHVPHADTAQRRDAAVFFHNGVFTRCSR